MFLMTSIALNKISLFCSLSFSLYLSLALSVYETVFLCLYTFAYKKIIKDWNTYSIVNNVTVNLDLSTIIMFRNITDMDKALPVHR